MTSRHFPLTLLFTAALLSVHPVLQAGKPLPGTWGGRPNVSGVYECLVQRISGCGAGGCGSGAFSASVTAASSARSEQQPGYDEVQVEWGFTMCRFRGDISLEHFYLDEVPFTLTSHKGTLSNGAARFVYCGSGSCRAFEFESYESRLQAGNYEADTRGDLEGESGQPKLIMVYRPNSNKDPLTDPPDFYQLHTADNQVFTYMGHAGDTHTGTPEENLQQGDFVEWDTGKGRKISHDKLDHDFIAADGKKSPRQFKGPGYLIDFVQTPEDQLPAGVDSQVVVKVYSETNNTITKTGSLYEADGEEYELHTYSVIGGELVYTKDSEGDQRTAKYQYEPDTGKWTLDSKLGIGSNETDGGRGLKYANELWSEDGKEAQITFSTKDRTSGAEFEKTQQDWITLRGTPRKQYETQDPDGLALVTTYDYFDNKDETHRYRNLRSMTRPGGEWTAMNYDSEGRKSLELRPWLDAPATVPENLNAAIPTADATIYEYVPHTAEDALSLNDHRPRTVTRQILGQVVSRTFYVYAVEPSGVHVDIVEQAHSPTAAYGDPLNLTRITRYYGPTAGEHAGRMHQIETPDGQLTTYAYAFGDWNETTQVFTPLPTGTFFQTTVTRGTVTSPLGVANETTRQVRIQNGVGYTIYNATEVFTDPGYETIAWTKTDYDIYGQPERSENSRGEITEMVKRSSCCSADEVTNAQGITTTTKHDPYNQPLLRTKVHPSGDTDKDLITEYFNDPAGRVVTETLRDGANSLSLVSSYAYDGTGRRIQSTPHTGGTTVMDYDDLNRITIQTNPDGSTVITERYLDGRTKSVTGTAVTAQYYEYGVTATGNQWTKVSTGPALASSPMWTKSYTNMLGQSIATERPGHNNTILTSGQEYNDIGQLVISTPAVGSATLYAYDELADQTMQVLDVNNTGLVFFANIENDPSLLAGDERITKSESHYIKIGSDWWMESKSYIYDDGEDTPTLTGISRQRLTGLSGVEAGKGTLVAESVSIDIHGNTSTSKRYLDRATQTALSEQDSSLTTASPDASSVNINGLATETQSVDPNSPASPVAYLTTTFDYDELERRLGTTDPRTGRSFVTYVPGKNLIAKQTDAAGNETLFAYYSGTDRSKSVTDPNGNVTTTAYTEDGQVATTWGATYPVVYTYDAYDRMEYLYTLRDPNTTFNPGYDAVTGVITPSSISQLLSSTMDKTQWTYEESTGLLLQKTYDDGNGPSYTYTPDGRLKTRVWARSHPMPPAPGSTPLTTTYDYVPNTLELATTTYSDGTATVTNTYDRLGRLKTTDDDFGQKAYSYNDELQPEEEAWTGLLNQNLTRTYKSDGRPEGISLLTGYDTVMNYSPLTGHLDTLVWTGSNNLSHTTDYHYVTNSQMIEGYTLGDLQRTVTYEPNRNLVDDITNTVIPQSPAGNILISKFDYTNDAGGRRTNREDTGTAFASTQANVFGYNARNEVTSAAMRNGTSTYNFDQIGNRVDAAVPAALTSPAQNLSYVSNALNQYTSITEGGTPSTPQYDDDGNLLNNGSGKTHTWTGENRLKEIRDTNPVDGSIRLSFTYDGQGRRVRKKKEVYSTSTGLYTLTSDIRFMYDGWNLLYEVDVHQTSQPTRRYVWGLDLSQSIQGAGGVGGLLFTESDTVTHGVTYDANGNISEYIDLSNGNITAHLEYDAFGRTIANTFGAVPAPFGFSTKYQDEESSYLYYGFRYYDPETGRWLNRDPIGEFGGINIYSSKNLLNRIDYLGLKIINDGKLVEETIKNLRTNIGNYKNVSEFIKKGGAPTSEQLKILTSVQAETGIQLIKDGKILSDHLGKFMDFYEKTQLLADVLEGKEDADSKAAQTLGETFIKKALSAAKVGSFKTEILIKAANEGTGWGNWVANVLYDAIEVKGCQCCLGEYIKNITQPPNGKYTAKQGKKTFHCHANGTTISVKVTKPNLKTTDGFFATFYKNYIKEYESFYSTCGKF